MLSDVPLARCEPFERTRVDGMQKRARADDDTRGPSGDSRARRASWQRRVAAALALLFGTGAVVAVLVAVVINPAAGIVAIIGAGLALWFAWRAFVETGVPRVVWAVASAVAVALVAVVLYLAEVDVELVTAGACAVIATASVRVAFGRRYGSAGGDWSAAPAVQQPVLFINPRSGDGKAAKVGLADAARARAIRPLVLEPDDDLTMLARQAVADGADALGMAGGDGSLAVVAAVAAEHDIPFVCIPIGTRNHFARDLGVDRNDPIGALDAFTGVESRIDLAQVNHRSFLNNVSLGVYAEAVHRPGYRRAKGRTVLAAVRDAIGTGGTASTMRFTDVHGVEHDHALLMLVSNNPYALHRMFGQTARERIDAGLLGVVVIEQVRADDLDWSTSSFAVTTEGPAHAGVDGEPVTLSSPLRFTTRPRALRVRISPRHPGVSPATRAPRRPRVVVPRLARLAAGRM
jgi:diacylglycerol kinase family enzyme